MLSNYKQRPEDEKGIYRLPGNTCFSKYIGETRRNLDVRIKKHFIDMNENQLLHLQNNQSHFFTTSKASLIEY